MKKLKSNLSAIAITGIILTGCQEDNPNNAVTSNNVSSSISTSKPSSATQVYNLSTSSSNVNNTEPTTTAVPIPSPDDEKTFNQYMYNGSEQAKVENKSSKSTVNSPEIRKQNAEYRKVIEKQYAEINNISLGEAKKRLAIMGNTDAVSMVKEHFGNDLTGIYYGLDEKGNFGLNVRTVKQTNRSVQDDTFVKSVLDKTNVPINLQSNASLSEKQINESIKLNSTEAKKILPSIQAVGYSPIEDVIYIEFYDKNKKYKEVEIASLETQLNKLFSYKVKLKQLDTPTESLSVIGGGELGNGSQSLFTSSCTSGFTAILNGVKGVLTAGHCYSATSIARYKVASKDSIFMTARLQGKLALKDNCLVIQQEGEPKPYLLALPISDDSSEWKIDLVGNQLLYKDKKYKLGEKLDLGGGFMEYSKLVVKPKGCENYGVWAGYILRSLSK